jgi:hypothetical protein
MCEDFQKQSNETLVTIGKVVSSLDYNSEQSSDSKDIKPEMKPL